MVIYELPFARIVILREDIAEVFINEGVEMNVGMVDQYHDFLRSHLKAPFSLLINKINAYSYDHKAQAKLATLVEINAMAVVAYKKSTITATEIVAAYPRDINWNIKIFSDRADALEWLIAEQS